MAEIADVRRFTRSLATLTAFACALTACASAVENVHVTLPAYQAKASKTSSTIGSPAKIRIGPVDDARTEFIGNLIGKKTTLGNMPMGHIEMSPLPTDVIGQLLRSELGAAGYRLVASGEDFSIGTKLQKFRVLTPATALYWDVNGAVEITMQINGSGGRKYEARYASTCTERSYLPMGRELITAVVKACAEKIAARLRGDTALTNFLKSK